MSRIEGAWLWSYKGGSFEVHFAPNSEFVCPSYPAHSHYDVQGEEVRINWGKYGNYSMTIGSDGKTMEGYYAGYPDEWRKAVFVRAHTEEERHDFLHAAAHAHNHDHGTCSGHHH